MRIALGAIGALMYAGVPAHAQDLRPYEYLYYEDNLNQTYRLLIARLKPADRAALVRSQRAWVKFREADCELDWKAFMLDCLIGLAATREEQLRTFGYRDQAGKIIVLPKP